MSKAKGGFYAVKEGRNTGVYLTWKECEAQIKGYPSAKFKKFSNASDADAFVSGASSPTTSPAKDTKGKKRAIHEEDEEEIGWDIVYSDGACKGNGRAGSVAGIGVWWGENDPRNIAERCPGEQTNNRAELVAIVRVLETTPKTQKPLMIKTDSKYSIQCFQSWLPKWKENNFRTATGAPVKNLGIIQYLSALLDTRAKFGQKIRLKYVKGHSGNRGNDGADAQANRGAFEPPMADRNWAQLEAHLRDDLYDRTDDPMDVPLEVEGAPETPGTPSKVRRVDEPMPVTTQVSTTKSLPMKALPSESLFSAKNQNPLSTISEALTVTTIRSPPRAQATVSPTPWASSPETGQESQQRLDEERGEGPRKKPSQKARHQALTMYPLLPETPTKPQHNRDVGGLSSGSGSKKSRLSDVPEDYAKQDRQPQLLGSDRAMSRALNLYPALGDEKITPAEYLRPSPKTPKKMAKHVDLDLISEPARSPRKAIKHGRHLPSASERFARSMSPAPGPTTPDRNTRCMQPTVITPKLTVADVNFDDYVGCLADDTELLEDLDDM